MYIFEYTSPVLYTNTHTQHTTRAPALPASMARDCRGPTRAHPLLSRRARDKVHVSSTLVCTHTYVHTCIHTYTHPYTHTHTHTHIPALSVCVCVCVCVCIPALSPCSPLPVSGSGVSCSHVHAPLGSRMSAACKMCASSGTAACDVCVCVFVCVCV